MEKKRGRPNGSQSFNGPRVNNTGKRYGLLSVMGPAVIKGDRYFIPCVCACGTVGEYDSANLGSHRQKSCGCAQPTDKAEALFTILKYASHLPGCMKECTCGFNLAIAAIGWQGFK